MRCRKTVNRVLKTGCVDGLSNGVDNSRFPSLAMLLRCACAIAAYLPLPCSLPRTEKGITPCYWEESELGSWGISEGCAYLPKVKPIDPRSCASRRA